MSSATSVNEVLVGYAAGRVTAQQLVGIVAAAYYREHGAGSREQLRPIIEVIEQAHPGVVELSGIADQPGFAVRLAERPFPKRYEPQLRQAVEGIVSAALPVSLPPAPGLFTRIVQAIRRVFRG